MCEDAFEKTVDQRMFCLEISVFSKEAIRRGSMPTQAESGSKATSLEEENLTHICLTNILF